MSLGILLRARGQKRESPIISMSATFHSIQISVQLYIISIIYHNYVRHIPFNSSINPFFYIIDGFRYGFLGVVDGSLKFGLFYIVILSCVSWFLAYILFKKGYKIKY